MCGRLHLGEARAAFLSGAFIQDSTYFSIHSFSDINDIPMRLQHSGTGDRGKKALNVKQREAF